MQLIKCDVREIFTSNLPIISRKARAHVEFSPLALGTTRESTIVFALNKKISPVLFSFFFTSSSSSSAEQRAKGKNLFRKSPKKKKRFVHR